MITIWDAVGRPALYDHERVDKVRRTEHTHRWDEAEWDPGTRRPVTADAEALRAGRGYNPWREADEKNDQRAHREQALTAAQIMSTSVVTVTAETTVGEAWDMVLQVGYRHMPVLNAEGGALVGMLSDRDLLRVAGTPDHAPEAGIRDMAVADIMRTPVFSARPTTPIRDIAQVLFAERVGAMAITDEDWRLVGIITRSDILRVLVNKAPLDLWV